MPTQDAGKMTNPLFNDNKFKLGVFAFNGRGTLLTYGDGPEVSWKRCLRIAGQADAAGLEAIIPYVRWKGGPRVDETSVRAHHEIFDTFAFAAAITQATKYSSVFSTTAMPITHPLIAAKQGATIDHIGGGRFSLNVVAGWNTPEFEMFGEPLRAHSDRYDQASEWMQIVQNAWSSEDEFDFQGDYYKVTKGESWPKPIQKPFPPIMNAAGSERGAKFAAKYADICYVMAGKGGVESFAALIAEYKRIAREEFNREIQIWTLTDFIIRDTEAEARDEFNRRKELENMANPLYHKAVAQLRAEQAKPMQVPGAGAGSGESTPYDNKLVGTPEQIVDMIKTWSDIGLAGVVMRNSEHMDDDLPLLLGKVLPLLEQAGLRKAFSNR
jgi:dimethylsulfone monooxygenase